MPKGPLKICCQAGCRKLVRDAARCPEHTEAHRIRRRKVSNDKPTDPFLGSVQWQKLRKAKMANNPLCEVCEAAGRTTAAMQVHHIEARQDAPEKALDWDNLACVCLACHASLTAKATRERMNRKDG